MSTTAGDEAIAALRLRHLRVGWWTLAVFVALGLGLEALHGLKAGFYLDVGASTRRLMWTLAHAHGALLGLVHLGFAATLDALGGWSAAGRRQASIWLLVATAALPAGFFLGGLDASGGDPGPAILLVPAGGLALLVAVLLAGVAATREPAGREAAPAAKRSRRADG